MITLCKSKLDKNNFIKNLSIIDLLVNEKILTNIFKLIHENFISNIFYLFIYRSINTNFPKWLRANQFNELVLLKMIKTWAGNKNQISLLTIITDITS